MKLNPINEQQSVSGAAGAAKRWASEFSQETWALDPLDMMTADEFVRMLQTKFGPQYLDPIDYERLPDGRLVPVQSPARRVRSLFRRHPEGLTRLQVKLAAGLSNGQVADIVRPPHYIAIGTSGSGRTLSQRWAPVAERCNPSEPN